MFSRVELTEVFAVLTGASLLAGASFAQPLEICSLGMSAQECLDAVYAELRPGKNGLSEVNADLEKARDEYLEKLRASVAEKESADVESFRNVILPAASLVAAGESSKTDFQSLLSMLVGSENLSEEGEALQIDLGSAAGLPESVRVVGTLREAKVQQPLRMALEEAELGDALGMLEEELDDFSDVSLEVKLSLRRMNQPSGRRLIDRLYDDILEPHRAQLEELRSELRAARDAREDEIAKLAKAHPEAFDANGDLKSGGGSDPVLPFVEQAARLNAEFLNRMEGPLHEYQYFRFGELVANESQWVVEFQAIERDPVAGSDELRAALSYEIGFPNLRGFRKQCSGRRDLGSCYDDLFREAGPKVQKGHRASFKIEYRDITTDPYSVPGTDLGISSSGEHSLVGAFSYGRNLEYDKQKKMATRRLELTVDHEEAEEDSMRNSRQKATLTVTQRLTAETSLVLGGVWASDPEFRGEVEREFSANFGISYKFLGSDDPAGGGE